MKTLIVEDDFSSRLLLHRYLSRYGESHIAVNGREAVAAFREATTCGARYDLICLDIMMPEMDGFGALRVIREMETEAGILPGRGVKVVMTTALSDSGNVFKAFDEWCDAYLRKPVELEQLLKHVVDFGLMERQNHSAGEFSSVKA